MNVAPTEKIVLFEWDKGTAYSQTNCSVVQRYFLVGNDNFHVWITLKASIPKAPGIPYRFLKSSFGNSKQLVTEHILEESYFVDLKLG